LGVQFLKSDKINTTQNPKVVVNEDSKETIQNPVLEKNKAVVATDSPLISKEEAAKIIEMPINAEPQVALQEVQVPVSNAIAADVAAAPVAGQIAAPVSSQSGYSNVEEETTTDNAKDVQNFGYGKIVQRESAKVAYAAEKQASMAKKSAPLIVLNGNAMSHSDDEKRDKMMQRELPNLQPENVDSLVILDQPLYIIDGIYYSENDLFGTNPTSPYAPLNKQEIKTITVLQDLEATSKYGEKGKKGVVIITTKTGKPAAKN